MRSLASSAPSSRPTLLHISLLCAHIYHIHPNLRARPGSPICSVLTLRPCSMQRSHLASRTRTRRRWTGPYYPNSTAWDTWESVETCTQPATETAAAKHGCLFDIFADPGEHVDLALQQPERVAQMLDRLIKLDAAVYQPDRGLPDHAGACQQVVQNDGYWGPWLL